MAKAIRHEVDDEAGWLAIFMPPGATGRDFARHLCGLLTDRPVITGYDFVCDLMGLVHGTNEEVQFLVDCYLKHRRDDGRVKYTCFATPDPNFHFWARSMDYAFPDRLHYASPTVEAAWACLDELRGRPRSSRSATLSGQAQ